MTKALHQFGWFESIFVLWLFSYQFKNAHPIFYKPDITILLTAILIPWALWKAWATKRWDPAIAAFLTFSAWCVASAFWSSDPVLARGKAVCLVVYIIPAFLMASCVLAQERENLIRFLNAAVAFAIGIHLYVFYLFWQKGVHIIDVCNTNYLVTGQTIGTGFIILFVASLYRPTPWLLGACGTLFYIAINLGGRGPVLAMLATVGAVYISLIKERGGKNLLHHLMKLISAIVIVYIICRVGLTSAPPAFVTRMVQACDQANPDMTIVLRLAFFKSAFSIFLEHPFKGVGLGGWPLVSGFKDFFHSPPIRHPHNLGFELLAETGLVGLMLFGGLIGMIFRRFSFQKVIHDKVSYTCFALLVFSFLNATKSGDIIDNIFLFVCLGICGRLFART